uniref:Retinoic acid receptor responder protein 2 n=1 Tax=Amphilophus citrinellus TaxID=61819 RepID=A0A3Q0T1M0_AMPCI
MAALLLWLFSLGAFFFSSNAQELPETYRKGVDLALENLHALPRIQKLHVFLRSVSKSEHELGFDVTFIYHHFLLKPTTCEKGTDDPSACHVRENRPLMDCTVCYRTYGGEIEPDPKPYAHCIPKPALTEEMKAERLDHCNKMGYSRGSAVLLGSKGNE